MEETNVKVDYDDERLVDVKAAENQAVEENKQLYSGMVADSDDFYNKQIEASQQWADKQTQIQNEQTDFAIEQIEQQKQQANKDYLKEQSGAYADWQKQSNAYGTKAEQMASSGLTNTGFSESSQVGMYNTYQNRVAAARETFAQATLSYDNAMKDARLQNNAALAEIAFNAYKEQLALSLQGFQYKNNLLIQQADKELQIKQFYGNKWQNTLNQINTENALAEEIRQFNENQAWQTEQNRLKREHELAVLEAQTAAEKEILDKKHENDMALLNAQYGIIDTGTDEEDSADNTSGIIFGPGSSNNTDSGRPSPGLIATPEINLDSVEALGIKDADELAKLIKEGKVKLVVRGGQAYAELVTTQMTSTMEKLTEKPGYGTATTYGGQGGKVPKPATPSLPKYLTGG